MTNALFDVIYDERRLTELRRLALPSRSANPTLDRLTRLAIRIFDAPGALVALVVQGRQSFVSCVGLPEPWISNHPLLRFFCQRVVGSGELLVISDAREYPLLHDNGIISTLGVAAYVGIPLTTSAGSIFGAFCVVDTRPRIWTANEVAILQELAVAAITEIELRDDVLIHQQAKEELRISFHTVVENLQEGLLVANPEDVIAYINPRLAQLVGYSPEELVGRPITDLFLVNEQWVSVRQSAQYLDGATKRYNAPIRRRDGDSFNAEVGMTSLRGGDGAIVGTMILITDVTARNRLEEQLLQSQKMGCIGRLVGSVAHDFNNMLTAILGYASLGQEMLPPDTAVREELDEIIKVAQSATSFIHQLLVFTRPQSSTTSIVNLNNLILDVTKLLRHLIGTDIELKTSLASDLGLVRADSNQIGQVLVNLAVNARDAMPDGGQLTITSMNGSPGFHHNYNASTHVLLIIGDTGLGMDEVVKQHLFEPFFTTKEPSKGTGLGLTTCYKIIEQHGGHIRVDSTIGKGTTITIALPRVQDAGAALNDDHTDAVVYPQSSEAIVRLDAE